MLPADLGIKVFWVMAVIIFCLLNFVRHDPVGARLISGCLAAAGTLISTILSLIELRKDRRPFGLCLAAVWLTCCIPVGLWLNAAGLRFIWWDLVICAAIVASGGGLVIIAWRKD